MRLLSTLLGLCVVFAILGAGGFFYVLHHYGRDLPDFRQLADYEPPVTTRIHAGDGRLLAEYAEQKRVFVPIDAIPKRVINAFLSAEDKTFYTHPGVDVPGVAAATLRNLRNIGSNRRPQGASTITQQVAKNFLLTNEVSIERKVKEAILSFRIEHAFTKDRILELYLNEIYLGRGSYGVAAAALNYFDKPMNQLTIAEAAYLAALPKAPNNYHPTRRPKAAIDRRNWVIGQMLENGKITEKEAKSAWSSLFQVVTGGRTEFVEADYFAEEVRRQLENRYGRDQLYHGGLSVRTTLDPKLQAVARTAMIEGLESYDRERNAWRGPLGAIPAGAPLKTPGQWRAALKAFKAPDGLEHRTIGVVVGVGVAAAKVGLADGAWGEIPFEEMKWARRKLDEETWAAEPKRPSDVVALGDFVAMAPVEGKEDSAESANPQFALRQIPIVQGGLVAIDPHTGRVLAMVGGYSFQSSSFNRTTQAWRQPGSAFKPFVYLAGLDSGYTPATRILDAPFVFDQGPGLPKWRPANYTRKFYGPSTMRLGIEKSRNLMTVRLAQTLGMDTVADYAKRFGIVDDLPRTLAMSLGASETTLMRMTAAYGMLVNGGKQITPTLIDRIQDRHGRTVFRHDKRACEGCLSKAWTGAEQVPQVPDTRIQIADPGSAYQVVSMLKGVVERGTGVRIGRALKKPLGGKTGTTNKSRDAWFVGFSPDLAVGVYVGFDDPEPLGTRATGSSVAAPIFLDFMKSALADKPAIPFRVPPGLRLVRVDAKTGQPAQPGQDQGVILEAFKPGTVPSGETEVLGGVATAAGPATPVGDTTIQPVGGTGGLY